MENTEYICYIGHSEKCQHTCNYSPRMSREEQDVAETTLEQMIAKKDLNHIQEDSISPKLDKYKENCT